MSQSTVTSTVDAGTTAEASDALGASGVESKLESKLPALMKRLEETIGSPDQFKGYKVVRRNGNVAPFEPSKVAVAMTKAFLAVEGRGGEDSSKIRDLVNRLTKQVVETLVNRLPDGGVFHIEHVQDQVEIALMRANEHEVARRFILWREQQKQRRKLEEQTREPAEIPSINVTLTDGSTRALDKNAVMEVIQKACANLGGEVSPDKICEAAVDNLYDGVPEADLWKSVIFAARALIEQDPSYSYVTARLLLHEIRREVLGEEVGQDEMSTKYAEYFPRYIDRGIEGGLIDEKLREYDLGKLGEALDSTRDLKFQYLGLQTLYDRYFLHISGERIELPQAFWMRVAMGLAVNEVEREKRAIEFYNLLSQFHFVSSTPTLFNSGTRRPQLSSCFLTTVSDDLSGIYESIRENALLSKYSGGLGNDWTPVRALGAHIKGTNGKSQGVVPFLKVVNDTAVAVNQGGKRKGAVCCYLEAWHLDIEEFLELRKNTGDDRRRTHDMNTANWIPDLFMQRVMEDKEWTLFSPEEVADLHDLYGSAFKDKYEQYEALAEAGQIKRFKKIPALTLWRKMLSMLYETGHPWITFKDPCNLRSPQQHKGVVHSSNLCTEITLNTSDSETAVCNLGSVNLVAHLKDGQFDLEMLSKTCRTAMRMLDNVIDINYYSVPKARNSNLRHRPVGLGLMGFQDALLTLKVAYASKEAVEFADYVQEAVSYYAILASSELAAERGAYNTYNGSLWSKGILPIDSIQLLREARMGTAGEGVDGNEYLDVDMSARMDWTPVRESIKQHGMRNSNCLAIAPTATIANIAGVSPSIEPTFQNLYVKSNLSGEFTILNPYLVEELKARELWDEVMIHDLKYFDGSVMPIDRIPDEVKQIFATAFEIDPRWLVECASRRQKWIDQSLSLNLYMNEPSGRKIDELYKMAWRKGLKTTYYLRTISATYAEKSTIHTGALNAVSSGGEQSAPSPATPVASQPIGSAPLGEPIIQGKVCDPFDTECEACQ